MKKKNELTLYTTIVVHVFLVNCEEYSIGKLHIVQRLNNKLVSIIFIIIIYRKKSLEFTFRYANGNFEEYWQFMWRNTQKRKQQVTNKWPGSSTVQIIWCEMLYLLFICRDLIYKVELDKSMCWLLCDGELFAVYTIDAVTCMREEKVNYRKNVR